MKKVDFNQPLRTVSSNKTCLPAWLVGYDCGKAVIGYRLSGHPTYMAVDEYGCSGLGTHIIENVPPEPIKATRWIVLWKNASISYYDRIQNVAGTQIIAQKQITITEGEGLD